MTMKKLQGWHHLCISPSDSILEAAKILQDTSARIVLVVDEDSRLIGIVTDGDIRRGLLAGVSVEQPCDLVLNRSPFTIEPGAHIDFLGRLTAQRDASAVPIVSNDGTLQGVWVTKADEREVDNTVLIMAGGKGLRLRPVTSSTPKPLVPLGGKPMLHHLLENLRSEGFDKILISVNYLGEQIEESVGDGSAWGLSVGYLREKAPLGTAGALGIMEPDWNTPLLVINADVLTEARFRDVIEQHVAAGADITVGMRVHALEHPYGVLDLDGSLITGIREKPVWREFVSAGVYVLSSQALSLVPEDQYFDMPDLLTLAIHRGLRVEGFPLHESWLDVGTPDDFRAAQDHIKNTQK